MFELMLDGQALKISSSEDGNSVVIADRNGNLNFVNRDGDVVWKKEMKDGLCCVNITEKGNKIFFGGKDCRMTALNSNGNLEWEREIGKTIWSISTDPEGNYIAVGTGDSIGLYSSNGDKIWEYVYDLNKLSLSSGGQILVKHNIIYFVMPNGRIGAIDNIVGEPVDYSFLNNFLQKNILHYNYDTKLHIHDNFLSLFEDNNILYTYDLDNEKFLLFDKKIYFVKSFYFLNNSLVVLENNNFLTSYNLINNKIFWKVDLSKILSKKENIIESFVINNTVLIFFSSGKIVQLNKSNGELLFTQDLNLNDIDLVTASSSYFIFNHINGKAFFYSQ